MKLFAKEKDIFLKIVNLILIVGAVISIIVVISTGINLINDSKILTYKEYETEVCTIDKLEYEGTDEEGKKEYDDDIKKVCKEYYLKDKQDKININKTNKNNFIIFLSTTIVLLLIIRLLNKRL